MSERALATATVFADALDRDDFAAAERCLAVDCAYDSPGDVIAGSAIIIAAYRKNAEWASRTFDEIAYASEVQPEGSASVRINYIDRTVHRGQSHEYRCQQIVDVGDDGLIVRIRHEELPGMREALEAYFVRVGVNRD